ncbi:MAG: class I SAM-dependent methyltransferase [Candidatus Korarchaeota archaeon]|nr:class I SAM-dependent methyltransferase [Thermoproteota archaeon]
MLNQYSNRLDVALMDKYYHRIDDKELYSRTTFTFDLWEIIKTLVSELKPGKRLIRAIDVGGGKGDIIIKGLKYGYEPFLTDINKDFLEEAERRYPELRGHTAILNIFDSKEVIEFMDKNGFFDIVLCLGLVLNHTDLPKKVAVGFSNLIKLANENSIIVVDFMLSELYVGNPKSIWAEFTMTPISINGISRLIKRHGLLLKAFHSIEYDYGEYKNYRYKDHAVRLFLVKPY